MPALTAHIDTFTRDNLPPEKQWPEFLLENFYYPEQVNVGVELTDVMVERGFGRHRALIGYGRERSYQELSDWTNRLAHVLVEDLGVEPGNRVLIRSANNPAMAACWLAATKAGAVVVNTMPMLRAGELSKIVNKSESTFALCDTRLMGELTSCASTSPFLKKIVGFDGTSEGDAELDRLAKRKPTEFEAVKTGRDDVALLACTSGTTGEPKVTMHFHRDLLAIADGYAKEVLQVTPEDVFIGLPPMAFTFGLGGLAIFPLRFAATSVLLEDISPAKMSDIIKQYQATVCYASPTGYQTMLESMSDSEDLSSLRLAVSAGETLPAMVFNDWKAKIGKPLLDGIGSTEMLQTFISNRIDDQRPGCTGQVVSGYEVKVIDDNGAMVTNDTAGRLAVRGPTGCRYLADTRQSDYVVDGWNITGDCFSMDEKGYLYFVGRTDDMIISGGYNIAGPEVEAVLQNHAYVRECAVVGAPDVKRGSIVEAHVVLNDNLATDSKTVKTLQDYVKASIAPYKYPRSIVFCNALPRTQTGKIKRFLLKQAS